jgi:hypothetical protein
VLGPPRPHSFSSKVSQLLRLRRIRLGETEQRMRICMGRLILENLSAVKKRSKEVKERALNPSTIAVNTKKIYGLFATEGIDISSHTQKIPGNMMNFPVPQS